MNIEPWAVGNMFSLGAAENMWCGLTFFVIHRHVGMGYGYGILTLLTETLGSLRALKLFMGTRN